MANEEEKKPDLALEVEREGTFAVTPVLFGRWAYDGVECSEQALGAYLSVKKDKAQVFVPLHRRQVPEEAVPESLLPHR